MNFEKAKDLLKIRKNIEKETVEIKKEDKDIIQNFFDKAREFLQELQSTQEGLINKKVISNLAKELDIPKQNLKKAFQKGLEYFIKVSLKKGYLNKKTPPEEQKDEIKKIVEAFALAFRAILKQFEREKAKGKLLTIETIIKKDIRKNLVAPKILKQLQKEFPAVKDYIILYAAFYNPNNPKEFINNFLKRLDDLKTKYKDINEAVIEYAVLYYPDKPEYFLENIFPKVKEEIERIL